MTILDFNNKVNLPRFCSKVEGLKHLNFKHFPIVGWLAYQDDNLIGNIYDLVSHDNAMGLFKFIVTKRPEFLEHPIEYNPRTDKLVTKSFQTYLLWESIMKDCQEALHKETMKQSYNTITCVEFYNQQGKPGIGVNNFGLLTNEVRKKYNMVDWPATTQHGRTLIVPSYITPKHIFSVEYTRSGDLDDLSVLYRLHPNREMGWYGSINTCLVSDIKSLELDKCFTYSNYVKPFIDNTITVDKDLPLCNLLDLNTTNEQLFGYDLIKDKLESTDFDTLKQDLSKLNKREVELLESKLNAELSDAWKESRKCVREINQKLYEKRPNGYYEISKNLENQITDFVFDNVTFTEVNDEVIVEAEFINSYTVQTIKFNYNILGYNFYLKLNKILLKYGIDVPFIDPSYETLVPRLILLFKN